ncbi:MAG: transposase, partial [Clostridium sp.]|nr:transposase [Clostridium sp.]
SYFGIHIQTNTEYVPDELHKIIQKYTEIYKIDTNTFVYGKGHRKSIQAEGTFGIIKNNRNYKRIVRKGIKSVKLGIFLVSIGHNLYKYHNKKKRLQKVA